MTDTYLGWTLSDALEDIARDRRPAPEVRITRAPGSVGAGTLRVIAERDHTLVAAAFRDGAPKEKHA